jgi:hypothetical protein
MGSTVGDVDLPDDELKVLEQSDLSAQRTLVDAEVITKVRSSSTSQVMQPGKQRVGAGLQLGMDLA